MWEHFSEIRYNFFGNQGVFYLAVRRSEKSKKPMGVKFRLVQLLWVMGFNW